MSETPTTPILKGSWEDLLLQAQQLAARQDEACIEIYRKLTDRLSRLPQAQRMAAEGRLQEIMRQAAVDMQYFLTYRDRYAEALAVNETVRVLLPEEGRRAFARHAAAIRIQAGEVDAGLAELRGLAAEIAAAENTVDAWGDALFAALDKRRFEDADRAIQEAEAFVNRTYQGNLAGEEAKRDQAFVAYLRSRLAAARQNGREALAWFQHAGTLDLFYRQNPQYLYTHLVDTGAHDEALSLIRTDKEGPIRAAFWQGIIHQRSGRAAEAQAAWRQAISVKLPEDGNVDYLELVLSRYYLGDHDGIGLASVLRAIDEDPGFWGLFYLAGLGWAMRNDMAAARLNMQLALLRRKSLAQGRKIPQTWWAFCSELLDSEKQAEMEEYFEDAQI